MIKSSEKINDIFDFNIAENILGSVYWKDKTGKYLGANEYAAKMVGLHSSHDLIGKTDYELFTKEEADEFRKNDLQVINTHNSIIAEEKVIMPDGRQIIQLSSKRPLKDKDGNVCGVIGNTVDITYLKNIQKNLLEAKEKAESANKAKEEFLKNMRHDLRTPFSGMFSLAEWMASVETEPSKKENLTIIADSAKLLLEYMNKVLDAARRGEKADVVILAPMNLKKLLQEAVMMVKPALALKPVELSLDYPNVVPDQIISDAACLERIVMNLLGNAAKFTHEGEIVLSVEIVKQVGNQLELAITVKDTGIGIPEDKREVIFEKFTRLDPAYAGRYSGTGLGLSDVKHLCEQLGGTISVTNNGSQGSVFKCEFSCKMVLKEGVSEKQEIVDKSVMPALKILLVEDQPIAAKVATVLLSNAGHSIDVAVNGRDALNKFNEHSYNLLLIDIGLPDIDGVAVAQQIREQETITGVSHTPLVALTAHQTEDTRYDFSVFDRVMSKPISLDKLNELVDLVVV